MACLVRDYRGRNIIGRLGACNVFESVDAKRLNTDDTRRRSAPAPADASSQRPAKAPTPPITQEMIVEPPSGCSTRRARPAEHAPRRAHADTSAAALYWHVGSKDGLLDLLFDRVIGEVPVPDADPTTGRSSSNRSRAASGQRSSATATSCDSRSAASRWVPTPCATPTGSWRSCAGAGVPDDLAVAGQQLLISDRHRLRHRRDRRRRGATGRRTIERGAARWPATTWPRSRRTGSLTSCISPTTSPPTTPTSASSCLDLFVDGLAQRAHI